MHVLVTGGAGFIGRWVVKKLLEDGHAVWALDDLSNGREKNLAEFKDNPLFKGLVIGDICDNNLLLSLFQNQFSLCFHLGASINVQDSIDNPAQTFHNDVWGTFLVLEQCRIHHCKMVFMSTCMVYDFAGDAFGITELHHTKPASPYAGSKIAGENLVMSYFYAYGLPVVVIRPFNTYGPFQKTGGEGGVVAIFIKRALDGKILSIYGDGTQTRDLLYVSDCADFVTLAGYSQIANGQIINAGLGRDISINDLAHLICGDKDKIVHVSHIHPQSEIQKLLCNFDKAKKLLSWQPLVSLEAGIQATRGWISDNRDLV